MHVFAVSALPSPQSLMRLLAFFAQRDLLPASVAMTRVEDAMVVRIVQDGLDDWQASIILERMRALPKIASAELSHAEEEPACRMSLAAT